jgi:hypothetical protein
MRDITRTYRPIGIAAGWIKGTKMLPRFVEAGTLADISPDELTGRYNALLVERDEREQLRADLALARQERDFNAGIIDGQNVAISLKDNKIEAQANAIRAAREQLRATSENWREDCLFRADEILTKALGEEAQTASATSTDCNCTCPSCLAGMHCGQWAVDNAGNTYECLVSPVSAAEQDMIDSWHERL